MLGENIVVGVFHNIYKLDFVNYLPEEVTDVLIPQPYLRKLLQSQQQIASWEHQIPVYLVVAAVYLIVYCVVCSRRFTTSDL